MVTASPVTSYPHFDPLVYRLPLFFAVDVVVCAFVCLWSLLFPFPARLNRMLTVSTCYMSHLSGLVCILPPLLMFCFAYTLHLDAPFRVHLCCLYLWSFTFHLNMRAHVHLSRLLFIFIDWFSSSYDFHLRFLDFPLRYARPLMSTYSYSCFCSPSWWFFFCSLIISFTLHLDDPFVLVSVTYLWSFTFHLNMLARVHLRFLLFIFLLAFLFMIIFCALIIYFTLHLNTPSLCWFSLLADDLSIPT